MSDTDVVVGIDDRDAVVRTDDRDVVVGVDGTAASAAALRWAAAEAARSGARLRIVHAFDDRATGGALQARPAGPADAARDAGQRAETAVAAAVAAARAYRPGIEASGHAVAGDAARVLTGMASAARLVVVGSRGHNALSAALGRSAGTSVAMHAPGCVAVVRGRTEAATGPVVVGVDGSHADNRVLATAFEHAARRGCAVLAVRVLPWPAAPWGIGVPSLGLDPVRNRAALRAEFADDVQRWHDKYPAVPASSWMPDGEAAAVLLDASRAAQLLVLGGRPHGAIAGLMLASVGQRLLYHADCPLLLVHGAWA